MKLLISLFLVSSFSYGNLSTLLGEDGADINLEQNIKVQKQLILNDPFVIQLYARWKTQKYSLQSDSQVFDLIFGAKLEEALSLIIKNKSKNELMPAAESYLLYKLGFYQTFVQSWINLAQNKSFQVSELAIALDQVVSPSLNVELFERGYYLNNDSQQKLSAIENLPLRINYSLQAIKALRSGEDGLKWVGKLPKNNILRIQLSKSAILDFARKGKLGASGKLIKKVIEPYIEQINDPNEISYYYQTLGRLLYQAGAFKQSEYYYDLIPKNVPNYLDGKIEALWVRLQNKNYSRVKGDVETLNIGIFDNKFNPEVYLSAALAHTILCQFSDAKNSIHRFISTNKVWADRISKELASDEPSYFDRNFYIISLENFNDQVKKELSNFEDLKITHYDEILGSYLIDSKKQLISEARLQWNNRKKILESSVYKIKFVRIELLSKMRIIREKKNQKLSHSDKVNTYQAGTVKQNQLEFPNDGKLWSDDLFHLEATIQSECFGK